MFETAVNHFYLDMPRAAATWLALLALAIVALGGLLTRAGRWRAEDITRIREAIHRRRRMAAEARDLERYAHEVTIAADRATARAERQRASWLAAEAELESAWQTLDTVESRFRRLAVALPFGEPRTPRTPAEYADRERYLHRAASAACLRRELPVLELSDVLAHRDGWDPRLHPVQQEIVLNRVACDRALVTHRQAMVRERDAWHAASIAAAEAEHLREEAYVAAERAFDMRRWLPAAVSAIRPSSVIDTVPVRVRRPRAVGVVGARQLAGTAR